MGVVTNGEREEGREAGRNSIGREGEEERKIK